MLREKIFWVGCIVILACFFSSCQKKQDNCIENEMLRIKEAIDNPAFIHDLTTLRIDSLDLILPAFRATIESKSISTICFDSIVASSSEQPIYSGSQNSLELLLFVSRNYLQTGEISIQKGIDSLKESYILRDFSFSREDSLREIYLDSVFYFNSQGEIGDTLEVSFSLESDENERLLTKNNYLVVDNTEYLDQIIVRGVILENIDSAYFNDKPTEYWLGYRIRIIDASIENVIHGETNKLIQNGENIIIPVYGYPNTFFEDAQSPR